MQPSFGERWRPEFESRSGRFLDSNEESSTSLQFVRIECSQNYEIIFRIGRGVFFIDDEIWVFENGRVGLD